MTTIVNYRAKEERDDFEVIQSKITANALFNFMREYSYLEKAILNMAICPRYYPEDISYLNLKYNSKDLTEWYIPMTCFCDIPLHQISYHAEGNSILLNDKGYGKFSIAFHKELVMAISKFNSVFSRTNNKEIKAPTALRKKLNLEAPKGYSYELMEGTEDMYVLRSRKNRKENSFQVRIKFPLEFEGMKIQNINELVEAMYRTQKIFILDESLQKNPPTIIRLGSSGVTKQMIGSAEKFPALEPLEVESGEERFFSVTFEFPHKISNDDVYFTKILFESFINNRLVAIKNKNQIAFTFDKEKFYASSHPELEDGVEIGVVNTREIISLELFGAELQFLEYTIYPRMAFKQKIDENREEIKMIFDLPEESDYYVLYSLDSINDFDMTINSQELFELTDNAVSIQDIDFSKSASR